MRKSRTSRKRLLCIVQSRGFFFAVPGSCLVKYRSMSLKSHIPLPRVLYVGCASLTKACHNRSRCRHLSDLQGEQTAHISGAVPQIILPYPGSHADWSESRGNGHFIVSRKATCPRIKSDKSAKLVPPPSSPPPCHLSTSPRPCSGQHSLQQRYISLGYTAHPVPGYPCHPDQGNYPSSAIYSTWLLIPGRPAWSGAKNMVS
jgi:hypothetical protein